MADFVKETRLGKNAPETEETVSSLLYPFRVHVLIMDLLIREQNKVKLARTKNTTKLETWLVISGFDLKKMAANSFPVLLGGCLCLAAYGITKKKLGS